MIHCGHYNTRELGLKSCISAALAARCRRKVPAARVDTKVMRIPAQPAVSRTIDLTRRLRVLIGALGIATGALHAAPPLRFAATLEQSTWETQSSQARCVLRHAIPEYGSADFTRMPGQSLRVRIDLPKPPVLAYQVDVQAVPPPWKHQSTPTALGRHLLGPTERSFILSGAEAQALFDALERGLNLEFAFGPVGAAAQALVAVSAVRFLVTAPDFQACAAALGSVPPQQAAAPKPSRPTQSPPGPAVPAGTDTAGARIGPASQPETTPAVEEDPYIRSVTAADSRAQSTPELKPEPEAKPEPESKPEPKQKRDAGAGLGLVEEVTLIYGPTQDELSDSARIELGSFAREYLAQKRRDVVLIAGSAAHGPLTRRRALEIKGYLVRTGLPATHVLIHVQGEKLPQRDGQPVQPPADATRMSVWRVR